MSPSLQAKSQTELVLVALGGMGEIGMNCYAYGLGTAADRRWIIVDLGVKFGEETEPGIDIVLPDPSFLDANRSKLHGFCGGNPAAEAYGSGPLGPGGNQAAAVVGALQARRFRSGIRVGHPFDPRIQCSDHSHHAGNRGPHGRLEDRPQTVDLFTVGRGPAERSR